MTAERRHLLRAALVAVLATTGLLAFLRPGRADLPSDRLTGLEAPDDGYWTSPLRRLAGTGRQDEFDDELALSLALPENALGALAFRLGVPADDARFAGSALALAATIFAALVLGGLGPAAALVALLLAAPILGHFGSDLGEGTAFGIVSLFGLALVRGRIGLAAFLAGMGLFQKACGWPLGAGVLAAVVIGPGRAGRLRSAAIGTACGVAVCAGIAMLVFGDNPLAFVARPFLATSKAGAWIDPKSFLLHAAFPCAFDVGPRLAAAAVLMWTLLPSRRPPTALIVAVLTGFAFAALFPDPWRMLPSWCLVPAMCGSARTEPARPDLPARMLSLFVLAQLGAALVWLHAHTADGRPIGSVPWKLLMVGCLALAFDFVCAWARRTRLATAERASRFGLLGLVGLLAVAVGCLGLRGLADDVQERRDLAALVSARLPKDAHLIAYSFLATSFRGTLYYPPFESLWEHELGRPGAPDVLYRLRIESSTRPPPIGYVVRKADPLGSLPFGRNRGSVPIVLETLDRR